MTERKKGRKRKRKRERKEERREKERERGQKTVDGCGNERGRESTPDKYSCPCEHARTFVSCAFKCSRNQGAIHINSNARKVLNIQINDHLCERLRRGEPHRLRGERRTPTRGRCGAAPCPIDARMNRRHLTISSTARRSTAAAMASFARACSSRGDDVDAGGARESEDGAEARAAPHESTRPRVHGRARERSW